MDSLRLWARDGEAVRQAIELGEIAHMETASEELTDEFLLFAIESGLLQTWAEAFPDPRREPETGKTARVVGRASQASSKAGMTFPQRRTLSRCKTKNTHSRVSPAYLVKDFPGRF
jgi:hypothetical protein